jgi:hypothetical protein
MTCTALSGTGADLPRELATSLRCHILVGAPMIKAGILCSLLVGVVALAQPAPDAAEQSRALSAMRDYALNYSASLPDFMCTQVTRRTYYPNENFRGRPVYDSFEEQITFVDHKESYTMTRINGEPAANMSRDRLGGMFSSGEFGTLLGRTFDPAAGTDFHYERLATQQGRRTYVFSFRVPQAKGYGLVESERTLYVAYKGLLYADPQTGAVLRIEMQCEIPKGSEYRDLDLTLDFRPADVAGREFTLPFHYHLHSRKEVAASPAVARSTAVSETINEADYKAYRRFSAESNIKFQ